MRHGSPGKVARLRVFEDEQGRFDRSVLDTGGAALVVSQFTLLADTSKGNRPSFSDAAPPGAGRAAVLRGGSAPRSSAEGVPVEIGTCSARGCRSSS